jgi:hypothetical protein
MGCVLAVAAFFVIVYVITRFLLWRPFIYGEGTPALNFPFGSPSHVALLLSLMLIIGVGAALALKRYSLLYFIIPALVLEIFQTGTRSIAALLAAGGASFFLLILLRGLLTGTSAKRELLHLLLSAALAIIALFATLDAQGERALSIFKFSPVEVASGKADDYRGKLWGKAYAKLTSDAKATEELPMMENKVYGMHNAYLDFWLNWGGGSAVSFMFFLLMMLYSATKLSWDNRSEPHYYLYAALLICLGIVLGAIYANPLLHLKFVWVLFGLIISLQLKDRFDVNKTW